MSWLSRECRTIRWRVRQKYFLDFTFIHIPKTAGSSVYRTLGLEEEHKTALELRGRIGADRWQRKFKFAFVRNPWDRVVSSFFYASKIRNNRFSGLTFSEWIKLAYVERHPLYFDLPHSFSPQVDWITDLDNKLIVDYVGRFENIQEDFASICERIGRPGLSLPHHNATRHSDYRTYYSDHDAAIIARWYKKDIEFFGYAFSQPQAIALPQRRTAGSRRNAAAPSSASMR